MKIEYICGCTCDSLTIDDVETCDMSNDEIKDCLTKLIHKISDSGALQRMLIEFMELEGEYEFLGTCDQCFDSICKYTYESS